MVIENVVQVGNPSLRKKSQVVKDSNSSETKKVIEDLIDSLRHHGLVGMSASQIGHKLKVFVTEIRPTKTRDPKCLDKLRIYINPKISWVSKKQTVIYEGCGSVAYGKLFGPVRRPEKVLIKATDETGQRFKLKANDLLARVIQHEYDHLSGVEFTEKLTDIKKIMSEEEYLKQVKKFKK